MIASGSRPTHYLLGARLAKEIRVLDRASECIGAADKRSA
jgi:hypothetical protein